MNEKTNQALVLRIYEEVWNDGNLAAAEDIFVQPAGVQRFVSEFLRAFPDLHHTVEELIAVGDTVVARFSARGTHRGQWKEYPPTGRTIHYTGVTIAHVVDGKVADHRTWWDTWEVIEQITA